MCISLPHLASWPESSPSQGVRTARCTGATPLRVFRFKSPLAWCDLVHGVQHQTLAASHWTKSHRINLQRRRFEHILYCSPLQPSSPPFSIHPTFQPTPADPFVLNYTSVDPKTEQCSKMRSPNNMGQQYFLEEESCSPPCRRTYKIQKGKTSKFCFSLTLQWDAVQGLKHEIYGSRL